MAGRLPAVDVQDLAGDERGPLEVEDSPDNVDDLPGATECVSIWATARWVMWKKPVRFTEMMASRSPEVYSRKGLPR
jgi:hypothetical protein